MSNEEPRIDFYKRLRGALRDELGSILGPDEDNTEAAIKSIKKDWQFLRNLRVEHEADVAARASRRGLWMTEGVKMGAQAVLALGGGVLSWYVASHNVLQRIFGGG